MASFTTSGSTPQSNSFLSGYAPASTSATPAGKALDSAANMSTPAGPRYAPPPVAAPTTPVKSTAITHPDGTQITTTYHAPEPGLLASATIPNASTGQTNQQVLDSSTAAAETAAKAIGGSYSPGTGYTAGTTQPASTDTSTGSTGASSVPTYSGLVGQVADTANNGSLAAQEYASDTGRYGAGNIPIGQSAANIASTYGQEIAAAGGKGAQFEAGQLTTGTSPVAEGNAAVTAQTTAAQQQALATGEEAALQGTQQELTAQDQAATAANEAAGQATTGQGQKLGGLESAAAAIAPQQNYPFVFNPATGTYTNAATGSTASASDLADAVLNGKMSYADAKSGASYLGTSSEAQLQAAILQKDPTANLNQLEAQAMGQQAVAGAPYSAQASNIGTAGTAQTAAWGNVLSTATTNAANYAAQQSAINAVGSQALTLMQSSGINPSSSQFANTKLNQVATQFSDPKYAAFNTAIQSLQARIGAALQAGEIPTAATGNAQAIANGNLTLGALASTLKQVDAEMSTFVGTQNSLKDYAQSQLTQGASGSQSGTSGGGSYTSSSGTTYNLPY